MKYFLTFSLLFLSSCSIFIKSDTKLQRPDFIPSEFLKSSIAIAEVSGYTTYNFKNYFRETYPTDTELKDALVAAYIKSFKKYKSSARITPTQAPMPEPFKSNIAFRGDASNEGKDFLKNVDADYVLVVRNMEMTTKKNGFYHIGGGDDDSETKDKISTCNVTLIVELWETRRQVRSLVYAVRGEKNPNKKNRDQIRLALADAVDRSVKFLSELRGVDEFSIYSQTY